jgi:plasmid stabilization system protein ParE
LPYSIKLLEEADKEFTEAAVWYEEQSEGLGTRFINVIQNKLNLIAQFPERYSKRKGNFREAPVKTFPYLIVYTVYKKEQVITVSAIFHASRNPKRKYRK